MARLRCVELDPTMIITHRACYLAQPCGFFHAFFGGRTPSLVEKLLCIEQMLLRLLPNEKYENDLFAVLVRYRPPFVALDIHRHDWQLCQNWRHFQQIKNEIVGPECEAVELFLAESRLVDTANQYHLWVHPNPGFRFPLGFMDRWVLEQESEPASPVRQDSAGRTQDRIRGGVAGLDSFPEPAPACG